MTQKEEHEISDEAKERAKNYMALKGALEVKEETLEEAAEEYYLETKYRTPSCKKHFIAGAKRQVQRRYSEEEVKHIVSEALQSALVKVDLEQWFKQFKKK
jgi:hypothetical protein